MPSEVWYEIIYVFLNFEFCTIDLGMDKKLHATIHNDAITCPCWD